MDLPDYDRAAHAANALTANHRGQHRCTDSIYYGPRDAGTCPVQAAVQVLCDTIDQTRALPHTACHDDPTMYAVAESMSGIPLREVPCSVDADVRLGWLAMARYGTEALAAALDPALVTP